MMNQSTAAFTLLVKRASFVITVWWLASLPISLPAWILLKAFARIMACLWTFFRFVCNGNLALPSAKSETETQTELSMRQLDKLVAMLDENEEAICDHRMLLDTARKSNIALRTELDMAVNRLALLSQYTVDLEGYKERLLGIYQDIVMPFYERLTHPPEAAHPLSTDDGTLQAVVLQALHNTQQLLVAAEANCPTSEPSPVEKQFDLVQRCELTCHSPAALHISRLATTPQAGFHEASRDSSGRDTQSPRQPSNAMRGLAKVLSFGSPTPSKAIVHVFARDV